MINWTSSRAAYLLITFLLVNAYFAESWWLVLFAAAMMQSEIWVGFCPLRYICERVGFEKSKQ